MDIKTIPLEFDAIAPVLEVDVPTMRLDVKPVEPGQQPRAEVHHKGSRESLRVSVEDGVVKVRLPESRLEWGPTKRLVLFVPAHVRARINSDFGKTHIERLEGCDLTISSQAGTLDLEQIRGRMHLVVDSGSLRGEGLAGTFDVKAGAGSVRLSIDALDAGAHVIRASMGSVRVELARGIDVKIETATVLGAARASFPSNLKQRL